VSGIVGLINLDGAPLDRPLLERLTGFMAYRGPDTQCIWNDNNVGLGCALLSIDATRDCDRQLCSSGDGIYIVADARIDGRAELADLLEVGNIPKRETIPDAQWILRAYQSWGTACVDHLLGDFTFAIWDQPRRQLFCARDHFGVKPFYFASAGRTLIFSNTLDCLRQHPALSTRLNDLAIGDFLLFGHNTDAETTTFADIRRLAPAHTLTVINDRWHTRRYWSLRVTEECRYQSSDQYIDRFGELLTAAVRDRLRAPRSAIYMSGGLDSPALGAAACGRFGNQKADTAIKAYCLVYDRLPDYERHFSTLAAENLAIEIDHMPVDGYGIFDRCDDPVLQRPEPYDWPLPAMTQDSLNRVCAHSREVLYGEDPSALLAPASLKNLLRSTPLLLAAKDYGTAVARHRRFPALGLGIIKTLKRLRWQADPTPECPSWFAADFARRIGLRQRWIQRPELGPARNDVVRPEAHRRLTAPIWQRLFEFNDPGATRIPVEYRYPYLDLRLVTFALALPSFPWCVDKYLLRAALRGVLPAAIVNRPKAPLAFDPFQEPLQRPDSRWIDDFPAVQPLGEYVIRDKIPLVTGPNYRHDSWLHLRPLILNQWLKMAHL
jgi:asparagine synthase (glutamine-hydrolysing)